MAGAHVDAEQREMLPRWATGSLDRIMPPVLPTSDEAAEFASIMGEVNTYVDEMFTKFVMGVESLDNFDTICPICSRWALSAR